MQHKTITKQQSIINKINAKQPFQFNEDGGEFIGGIAKRLHRSLNPSQKYNDIYKDIAKYTIEKDAVLVGFVNSGGWYEVLVYQNK